MTTRIKTFGGNIGIGTDDPGSFRLNVNGDVKADSLVINNVTNSHIPIGLIAPWYGTVASIPTGWVLCNGATGITRSDGGGTINAPDLRDRFVRGVTSTPQVGQTAGANTITLSVATLPPHTHTFTSQNGGLSHQHPLDDKAISHAHGQMAQSTAPHNHATSQNANMAHNHVLDTKSIPHAHNNPGPQGYSNIPHNHGSLTTNDVAHVHGIQRRYSNPARGNLVSRTRVQSPDVNINTGTSNMPHDHRSFGDGQAPHTHGQAESNVPHDHGITNSHAPHTHGNTGAANSLHDHTISTNTAVNHSHTTQTNTSTAHAHTGTTASTGQATAITITNPYYVLSYIMKI